ncbi:MAG: DUF1611 domain-containing protein [Desulfobacter sp.]|nr:DUF1611 domain-containing protein [Desulfobacter sp.]
MNQTQTENNTQTYMGTAVVLTQGRFHLNHAKTAHGLVRGTERFKILGVIDEVSAGKDAGVVLDGVQRDIPIFPSVQAFTGATGTTPDYAVIGVALCGGRLDEAWQTLVMDVMSQGISIVNGLHMPLSDIPAFKAAAEKYNVEIIDFRRSKPFDQLNYWTGKIFDITTPRIAVLGTDCALGKRTTSRMLMQMCRSNGIKTEFIFTGQTGWLQGSLYGFILDATPNDFVSGELEAAIIECEEKSNPDLMILEGQSALRNPLGPCGAELIVSADAKGVILQHTPFRKFFDTAEAFGCCLPTAEDEIKLIEMYGAKVIAVTLNGEGGTREELVRYAQQLKTTTKLPVIDPLNDDLSTLLPVIRAFINN